MDQNKLTKLEEIGYEIKETCNFCIYSNLSKDGWGACALHQYDHKKHSGAQRQLSISAFGWCPMFESNPLATKFLGTWKVLCKKN